MANDVTWWWALRQAFGVPDLVSDRGALHAIVETLAQARPDESNKWPASRSSAEVTLRRVCALGAAGELDDVLIPGRRAANEDAFFNRIAKGDTGLYLEDKPIIDACLDRLVGWVRGDPFLPDSMREVALPFD
jgi:hypothetical protein